MGTFWRFWRFSAKTVCNPALPGNPSLAEKTVHHPPGVISEVLPRVDLGPGHAGSTKSTLGMTSEMTPMGGVPFSLLAWIPGGQDCTPFSQEIPKISKKCPKQPPGAIRGPPPPNLYLYKNFRRTTTSPKVVFFNPVPILGLKKHHFGALAGTRKKIIEVQDKKRAKRGVNPPK